MTRVEFFFNVPDKLIKASELCERGVARGRKISVLTQSHNMSKLLQQQLWQHSATSFLPSSLPKDAWSELSPIMLITLGDELIQDDVLINLQSEHPAFFSRFRYLAELVGLDEADKAAARARFRFYKDRGYEVKSQDVSANI